MRGIFLVLTVAAMTAAMLIVIASPAVAQQEFAQLDGCWVYDAPSGQWLYACGDASLP